VGCIIHRIAVDSLARLSLDSLYCRRVKADLTVCYKIINNLVCIKTDLVLQAFKHSLHKRQQYETYVKPNCIINTWISLPDYVVPLPTVSSCILTSPTVACFRHRLKSLNFTLWYSFYCYFFFFI